MLKPIETVLQKLNLDMVEKLERTQWTNLLIKERKGKTPKMIHLYPNIDHGKNLLGLHVLPMFEIN
jgi:hypothetical protein